MLLQDGAYLDCSVFLGGNSSYSVSEGDHVYFEHENGASLHSHNEIMDGGITENNVVEKFTDLNLELKVCCIYNCQCDKILFCFLGKFKIFYYAVWLQRSIS